MAVCDVSGHRFGGHRLSGAHCRLGLREAFEQVLELRVRYALPAL